VKKLLVFCLLFLSLPAVAVDGSQVKYVGGTLAGVAPGTIGKLDTTHDMSLTFDNGRGKLEIPYDAIQSFEYQKEVTRHLGVLPAIAVSLFRIRQHRHFFRISYLDTRLDARPDTGLDPNHDHRLTQAVVFEVPKHMPRTLQAVLETRSPQAIKLCGCKAD